MKVFNCFKFKMNLFSPLGLSTRKTRDTNCPRQGKHLSTAPLAKSSPIDDLMNGLSVVVKTCSVKQEPCKGISLKGKRKPATQLKTTLFEVIFSQEGRKYCKRPACFLTCRFTSWPASSWTSAVIVFGTMFCP